jgi:tetratricopeptide (TPR) repeat protein
MRRRTLGTAHPDVAGSAASLGYWLIWTRDYAEAARLVDESLAIRRQALGADHPLVASTLNVKANLLLATGEYGEALRTARAARQILAARLPATHWQVAMAVNAEGAALAGLGQFDDAEALLKQSIEPLASAPLPGVADRGRARLRDLYAAARRPEPGARPR